ncbi:MAG TPA: glycine zipper domain-containing protein [Verrucomicrobiae bacterium]|nr:glycine zipper domain-containing protein [Verrucomicrobiae bacterium]
MKTTLRGQAVVGFAAATLLIAGCTTPEGRPDRTATGALTGGAIGAATGAIIGNYAGHNTAGGAAIGGAIGALTGGIIGHAMDQQQREILAQQSPQTLVRVERGQPLGLADIKALAKAGIGDEVIISQLRNSHMVYHLSTSEIIDLTESGVSQRVIAFMIDPQGMHPPSIAQPPPPPTPARQATPVIDSAQALDGGTSLSLPSGSQLYVFGTVNGGAFTTSTFQYGQTVSLTDANPGFIAAELAASTANVNSYTTATMYHVIGGFGVSHFSYAQGFYGANPGPGAHSASVQLTLSAPALVILLGEASSQQQLAFSGLPNLVTDVPYTTSVALSIAHAYVTPGTYTVQQTSLDTAAGQDPNHMVDLLGVLVLSDEPNTAVSSNPSIPLPASVSTGVSRTSRPSPSSPPSPPSTSEPPEP